MTTNKYAPEYAPNRAARRRGRRAVVATVLCASMAAGATAVSTNAQAARDGTAAANSVLAARSPRGGVAEAAVASVTGVADDGTVFTGTFTLDKFREHKGVLYAVGQLDGTLGAESVSKQVSLPVTGGSNPAPTEGFANAQGFAQQIVPTTGACSILALDLGVLDLNLLGLHVVLDEVHLLIEAVPGAGALLGNLLCGVVGILDGLNLGGLVQNLLDAIADLLNGILGV